MEIILAIVVASAVILFGALISMGNGRQRKAIDSLREQVVLWALQDLRIKREGLARDVRIDDPLGWLNTLASKKCGYDLKLQVEDAFDEPPALICVAGGGSKVIFSSYTPMEIRSLSRERRSRLSQYVNGNPLMTLPRKTKSYEFSALNSGILFDLELPIAWKCLTGKDIEQNERIWMYIFSS